MPMLVKISFALFLAEEGLFFLPAAAGLFAVAVAGRHHGRALHAGWGHS